jgi:hypothetical protein
MENSLPVKCKAELKIAYFLCFISLCSILAFFSGNRADGSKKSNELSVTSDALPWSASLSEPLSSSQMTQRSLRHIQHANIRFKRRREHEYDPGVLGASNIVPKITVYGAILITDVDLVYQEHDPNATITLSTLRAESVRNLTHELPFPVSFWPALFTEPCPFSLGDNKKERGLGMQQQTTFIYIFVV